jgi:hypothetical protein
MSAFCCPEYVSSRPIFLQRMQTMFRPLVHPVVLLVAALALSAAPAPNPSATVEQVIDRYFTAMGGVERLQSVRSFVQIGLWNRGGSELLRFVYAKAPNKLRVEMLTPRGRIIQGCDGVQVWAVIEKRGGEITSLPLSKDDKDSLFSWARLATKDPLLDAQANKRQMVLRDDDPTAEGQHLLVVSDGPQELFRLRIDRATGRPLAHLAIQGQHLVDRTFLDYRLVDDVPQPFETVTSRDGQESERFLLADVRYNEAMDDTLFAPPAAPKTKATPLPGKAETNRL